MIRLRPWRRAAPPSECLNGAARRATSRQHAAAYAAWEAAHYRERGLDVLDVATAAASLDGAEW